MKVTPRVPVPRDTFPPGFTEMRYIRFEPDSWVAAMLFALFEAASNPTTQPLKSMLLDTFNRKEEFYQSLLKGMTDFCEKRKVAFWNSKQQPLEYLKLIIENTPGWSQLGRDELWGKIQSTFHVVVCINQTPEYTDPQWSYVYLWEYNSQVTILYQGYTVESFAAPPCGCVLLKYSCFQAARYATGGRPANISAFKEADLACPGCSQNESFADFVFHCGKETAQINADTQAPECCESCGKAMSADTVKYCDQCRICDCCALFSLLTPTSLLCPSCGSRLQKYSLVSLREKLPRIIVQDEIREQWNRIVEEFQRLFQPASEIRQYTLYSQAYADTTFANTEISQDQRKCIACSRPRRIGEFKVYLSSSHRCFVCDICLKTAKSQGIENCSKCSGKLERKDLNFIDQLIKAECELTLFACHCCKNIFKIDKYQCNFQLSHWWECRVCDFCFAFNPSYRNVCGSCSISFTERDKDFIQTEFQSKLVKLFSELNCVNCKIDFDITQYSKVQRINHMCRVCDSCMTNENKLRPRSFCPSCKKPLEEIAPGSTQKQCKKCELFKVQEEFSMKDGLHNPCEVCNNCLEYSTDFPLCPVCLTLYDSNDKALLLRTFPSLSSNCKKCEKPAKDGKYQCRDGCLCSECHLTAYLLTNRSTCEYCNCEIIGTPPKFTQCTRCHREIYPGKEDIRQSICAVCKKGCILCCYCIDVSGDCRNCSQRLLFGKYQPGEIIQIQSLAGDRACYCLLQSECTDQLLCGHRMHRGCKEVTFVCRMCSKVHISRSEKVSLQKYLK